VSEQTLYERVGGQPFFEALVDHFYDGVAGDAALLALYPEPDDLGPARERLMRFLVQYWGGPTTYSDARGHPRLRMRHAPFAIGPLERDRWLLHMRAAIDATAGDDAEVAEALHGYVTMAAEAMQNRS
jgi:hemoglobin